MDQIALAKFRIAELEQKVLANDPSFKNILKEIHENIRKTPELLYALSDEEIAKVVQGLSAHTGVEIAAVKSKEKITKAKAAKLTENDV